jgi:hypothetical protein
VLDLHPTAVADDRVHAALAQHPHRDRRHAVLADEVEHRVGAEPAGVLQHNAHAAVRAGQVDGVRPERAGERLASRVVVEHHDPRGRVDPQQLDREVAEAAGADHHDRAARMEEGDDPLDRVDRGEAGVCVRGQRRRVRAGRQLDEGARARAEQLAVSAFRAARLSPRRRGRRRRRAG